MWGRRSVSPRAGLAAIAVLACLVSSACVGSGTTKSGATQAPSPAGPVTLRFASGEPRPHDAFFAKRVEELTDGQVKIEVVAYDALSTTIDVTIVDDLLHGRLDVIDVASRAWRLHVAAFRAYQAPFLVTSRGLLRAAVAEPVSADLLASLRDIKVEGLAVVPRGVRFLFSTRPMSAVEDFSGAVIRVNEDSDAKDLLASLGAEGRSDLASGGPTRDALRDGTLTGVEADVQVALSNGYLAEAPYVLTGAPLYAKTTTFAAASSSFRSLSPSLRDAVRRAAAESAGSAQGETTDRSSWAAACAAGAKPVAVSAAELDGLRSAAGPVFASISATRVPKHALDRIGLLATQHDRLDPWTSCDGDLPRRSSTSPIDGRYETTVTVDQVAAAGECIPCGNAARYVVTIADGRYAIQRDDVQGADPANPIYAFDADRPAGEAIEVGSVHLDGDRATFRPEDNQQFGAEPSTLGFRRFRGKLEWTYLSGATWVIFTDHPMAEID